MGVFVSISSVFLLFICCIEAQDIGTFWQITDIHYDANYSELPSSSSRCYNQPAQGSIHGEFGDYSCDSPWNLVVSAINAMKLLKSDADFVIWTGDSIPHVSRNDLNPLKVFTLMQNVTAKLAEVFQGTPIFPVLGNHDVSPQDQIPPHAGDYYDSVLKLSGWENLLDEDSRETFQKGGFFSLKAPSGQRILGLNTVLYYTTDELSSSLEDPALQFMWLEDQLKFARNQQEQVYIIAHIPPGTMSREPDQAFMPNFNERFLDLLQTYKDVIKATFFGHEHTDSFHIVYDKKGNPASSMFMAPALTPMKLSEGANNPSIRLYQYNRATGEIVDYLQYYLDLASANGANRADWKLEYQATKAYNIKDVSASELNSLVKTFKDPESEMFRKYFLYNLVSYDTWSVCNEDCKVAHICSMTNLSYPVYETCIKNKGHMGTSSHFPAEMMQHQSDNVVYNKEMYSQRGMPVYMYVLIGGVVVLISVVILTAAVLCIIRKRTYHEPEYMPIEA